MKGWKKGGSKLTKNMLEKKSKWAEVGLQRVMKFDGTYGGGIRKKTQLLLWPKGKSTRQFSDKGVEIIQTRMKEI